MAESGSTLTAVPVRVDAGGVVLSGDLIIPTDARGLVVFSHGSGSSRFSPRNRAVADVLLHDAMYELFCTDTNIVPEATYRDGAIIVLDMPIREYGKLGIQAQRLFKYMWQRAMLRRDVTQHPRPVLLFCDEAQNFLDGSDFLFQAEAREVRAASVYITQNINNYYAVLGNNSRDEVNALLAYDRRHGWRGAEASVVIAEDATPAAWQQELRDYRAIAGLQPGLVTEVDDETATLFLADGQSVALTLDGYEPWKKSVRLDQSEELKALLRPQ